MNAELTMIKHPDFRYVGEKPHDAPNGATHYVVFARDPWIKPSAEQLAEFDRNELIVRKRGGRMILLRHELAGETPRFTDDDVLECRRAVERDLPGWEIVADWNGTGTLSLSLGIKRRPSPEPPR